MELFNSTEFSIPMFQIMLLLLLSTLALLFGRAKLALLINYVFTFYWGYIYHHNILIEHMQKADNYIYLYIGFGLAIVFFGLIGFLSYKEI